jgi:hypothetical protein
MSYMDDFERGIIIGGGIEGYRAYQATGDRKIAGKAAVSGGATVLGGTITGFVAFFCAVSSFGGFVSGQPALGFIFFMGFLALVWVTITLLVTHDHRMKRYMAPQPVPAPPLPPTRRPSTQPPGQEGLQYTFDLRTGKFGKHW